MAITNHFETLDKKADLHPVKILYVCPRWVRQTIILVCLLIFFGLTTDTALQKNPTPDEPFHLTNGLALWQNHDFRLLGAHIPLSHWIIGALVQTEQDLPDMSELHGWNQADFRLVSSHLVWESGLDVDRIFYLGRLPLILIGLIMGSILINWAYRLGGRLAALIMAILFAFAPNLLAHASLATTDLMATFGYVATIFLLWRYLKRPNHIRWFFASLGLGIGLTTKMTGLLLLPITLLICYSTLRIPRPRTWYSTIRPLLLWLYILPFAGLVLWATYLFRVGSVTIPQLNGFAATLPAPAYLHSFLNIATHVDHGHPAFFLGELSSEGWWHYFIVVFLIKTPIITLFFLLVAIVTTAQQRKFSYYTFLWLPPLLLLFFASYTRLNLGYRYILPALPFVLLWGAVSWANVVRTQRDQLISQKPRPVYLTSLLLTTILLGWYVTSGLWQHPHHLAYFNEIVGGPKYGYQYLGDSNLDWGQDWKTAARFVEKHKLSNILIAPSGVADLSYYGLNGPHLTTTTGFPVDTFSPANPEPSTYLLSTNALQGFLPQPDQFDWFRRQNPAAMRELGYSIVIFEVTRKAAGEWIAYCTDPEPLLTPEEASRVVNQPDLHYIYFNCYKDWVLPNNETAGWYVLPPEKRVWWPAMQFPEHFRLVYRHTATMFAPSPSYDVFYWDGLANISVVLQQKHIPTTIDETASFTSKEQLNIDSNVITIRLQKQ